MKNMKMIITRSCSKRIDANPGSVKRTGKAWKIVYVGPKTLKKLYSVYFDLNVMINYFNAPAREKFNFNKKF
jgi:hypothetical protein